MIEVLLWNTLVAAALAAVVLVLCRFFQPSPATRHALWLVVVVKLLSPVGLLWSVPLPFEQPRLLSGAVSRTAVPTANTREAELPTLGPPNEQPLYLVSFTPNSSAEDPEGAALIPSDYRLQEAMTAPTAETAENPVPNLPSAMRTGSINFSVYEWLLIVWLAGAIVVAWRYLWRTWCFARYSRSGKPAAPSLQRQVAELSDLLGVRPPEVRVLADLPSPVVWCLWRRVLLWPKGLQDQLKGEGRRAVLIHELAHLRRRDHWVRWLELLAAVIHWWNPLFWLVRRQLRFHAELACDAWVTGTLPDSRRSYAEALLEVCMRTSKAAAPSPAVGAGGDGRNDFQRRLTMIMREQAPCRLAAGAKLCVVLLALAAIPAWTLGQAKLDQINPAPSGDKAAELQKLWADLVIDVDWQLDAKETTADETKIKEIQAKMAELNKQLRELKLRQAAKGALKKAEPLQLWLEGKTTDGGYYFWSIDKSKATEVKPKEPKAPVGIELKLAPGQGIPAFPFPLENVQGVMKIGADNKPAYKVIGPDGKEIKGAKVVFGSEAKVEEQASKHVDQLKARYAAVQALGAIQNRPATASTTTVALSRATYKLSKEKAEALAAFLKANVKASVLELKVENDGLVVTTTPEAQSTIGGIVKLMGSDNDAVKKGLEWLQRSQELKPNK
jgi:beta-lactamase regulating signal transducer with metallopeptidase domain